MENFFALLRQNMPVRLEVVAGSIAGTTGAIMNYLFGPWNDMLATLIIFMLFDYFTGIFAAYINPRMSLNSEKGFKGVLKKIIILILIALSHCLDRILGQTMIYTMVTCFFIMNEGLSILENSAKAGLPIPAKLRETLEQLTEEKAERRGDKNGSGK